MRLTSVPLIHFKLDSGSMSWMAKKAGQVTPWSIPPPSKQAEHDRILSPWPDLQALVSHRNSWCAQPMLLPCLSSQPPAPPASLVHSHRAGRACDDGNTYSGRCGIIDLTPRKGGCYIARPG